MIKKFIQDIMPGFYKDDPWLNAILDAVNSRTSVEVQRILDLSNYNNLGRMNGKWLEYYENLLGIRTDETKDLSERRANILARWKASEKPNASLIQAICDGWQNGSVQVGYEASSGTITLTFGSEYGVPKNIDELKKAMSNIVPAHLKVQYDFKYLLIEDVDSVLKLSEIETKPLSVFAF